MLAEVGIALGIVVVLTAAYWLKFELPGWLGTRWSEAECDDSPQLSIEDALMSIDPCGLGIVDSEDRYRQAAQAIAAYLGSGADRSTSVLERRIAAALADSGCGEPRSARKLRRVAKAAIRSTHLSRDAMAS